MRSWQSRTRRTLALSWRNVLVWGRLGALGGICALAASMAQAHCYELASARYRVPAALLRAIAQQESGGNPAARNVNRNGSVDLGLMQINSQWLPVLGRHGIGPEDLWDPCVSVLVGAWILSNNFGRMGYTLQALGAYNSSQPEQRVRYARQVLRRLHSIRPSGA